MAGQTYPNPTGFLREAGDPVHEKDRRTNPGATVTPVLSYTVPATKKLCLSSVYCSFVSSGLLVVKQGADIIGQIVTSPAKPNDCLNFDPRKPIAPGVTVSLEFCGDADSLYAGENVFTCLQGLLKEE